MVGSQMNGEPTYLRTTDANSVSTSGPTGNQAGLHTSRQAGGERLCWKLQRSATRWMFERRLVHERKVCLLLCNPGYLVRCIGSIRKTTSRRKISLLLQGLILL